MTGMLLAPGGTIDERLNNAIVTVQRVAYGSSASAGVRNAIALLHDSWQAFRRQTYLTPPLTKWQRYAAWYTRGWLLLSPALRAQCPDPRSIDASFAALAQDQINRMVEASQAVTHGTAESASFLANEAAKLGDEVMRSAGSLAEKATSAFREIALVALLGLGLWVALKYLETKPRGG